MIKVSLYRDEESIKAFECKGHADYRPSGETDEVCAGVTAIASTTVAALSDILSVELEYKFEEGYLYCKVLDMKTADKDDVDLLFKTFKLGCDQIEYSYGSEYVKVNPEIAKLN